RHPSENAHKRLTRRGFLRASSSLATGLILAGCGVPPRDDLSVGQLAGPMAPPVLPSPAPITSAAVSENPALERFLALSSVLTGFDNLDPTLGQVYLDSIEQSSDYAMTVDEMAQAVGVPSDAPPLVADLEAAGLFNDPA